VNWKTILTSASALLSPLVGTLIAGKGTKYQSIAQVAVKSAVTKIDGGIDKLVESYQSFRTDNEIVAEAQNEFLLLAKQAGFVLPSVAVIQTHVKAAIYDLATAIVPNAGLTASDTIAPSQAAS